MHSSRTLTAVICLLVALSTLTMAHASPAPEGGQARADRWRWVVEDDDSEQATVAVFSVRERLDVVSLASSKTRITYDVGLIADDFEEAARALDPKSERRGFALLDVSLTVEGQPYSISMMYGQGPDGKEVDSWVIVQVEGPSRAVRRRIVSGAEALYRQHPVRIDCTPRAAPEESAAHRACYPQSAEDHLLAHAHRVKRPVSPPAAMQSAPAREAATAPEMVAPRPPTVPAATSNGAATDHRQSIIDFLGIVKSDEEFNAMQKEVAEGVRPTLDLLTAVGGARCAALIQEKLSTSLFLRDEIARFMLSRTQAAQVGRAVTNAPVLQSESESERR